MARQQAAIAVHRNRPYRETAERVLELDVYEPPGSGEKPGVVLVHGGGFVIGRKGELASHALELADRGYVAVTPEYRLGDEAPFPAAPRDVAAAIGWLRTAGPAHGVDPARIAAVGYSAGANLATLAAVTAENATFRPEASPEVSLAVDAVVGYAGVYDVGELAAARRRRYLGTDDPAADAVARASPLGRADEGTPPTLLLHGLADEVVDPDQSRRFHEELSAVTEAELVLLEGEGADHDFPVSAHTFDETVDLTAAFLDRHV